MENLANFYWAEGKNALSRGENEEAQRLFRKSVENHPKFAEPYIKLFELQTEREIELIYKSIEIEPTKWAYFHLLAHFSLQKNTEKKIEAAREMFDFFKSRQPELDEKDKTVIKSHLGADCFERKIVIKVENGLANRLRTLNSFYSFAKTNHARLLVHWGPGPGWSDEHFLDLFEPIEGVTFISKEEFENERDGTLQLNKRCSKSERADGEYIFFSPKKQLRESLYFQSFSYEGDSCLEFIFPEIKSKPLIYPSLKPKRELEEKIQTLLQLTQGSIGLHMRRGDSHNHPWQEKFKISDDSSFERFILEELKNEPRIIFFLSTDCRKTNDYFTSKFPNNIIFNKEKHFAESRSYLEPKLFQSDAVIDLFVLSRSRKIAGSNFSTFSELASLLHGAPLTIAKNERLITKLGPKKKSNLLKINFFKGWQMPAFTEKQAYFNHSNSKYQFDSNLYVAFPWASLIDYVNQKSNVEWTPEYLINEMISWVDMDFIRSKESHTVCQHIKWRNLVQLWQFLGIRNIYVSHLTLSDRADGLNLFPWHLTASNFENSFLNKNLRIKPIKEKKYLCSFVGSFNKFYRSDIRNRLHQALPRNDEIFFELQNDWFLNEIVYNNQICNRPFDLLEKTKGAERYNSILSDSIFSLCPDGTGPNTIRLWESLSVGSIPVLFESDWIRPQLGDLDWSDISLTIKDIDLPRLTEILKSIPPKRLTQLQTNCINAYSLIRTKTCF